MIETEQSVSIAVGIDDVWAYAKDVERWAEIMPGYQTCDIEDEDRSLWVLKVGVGGMVRTVKVRVHVDEWDGPQNVRFSFALQGDPVEGSGTYRATPTGPRGTDVVLAVQVAGSGPMAPMWEAMGGPVLPKFAKAFAEQLRDRIEAAHGGEAVAAEAAERLARPGLWARFMAWLRRIFGRGS
jgi:carbon monoxide dehydrogenase subunit G